MAKRKDDPVAPETHDKLELMPLGAGNEVGRSCVYMSFKGKNILFDSGLHLAKTGIEALPYFDEIDPSTIDVLLVTHFHLDHAASLPYLLFKTNFKGRIFMTHATKAVYRLLLSDFVKVTKISTDGALFTEQEILDSMDRIEVIDFHQVQEVNGIRFWCYVAGHVLGAAMFAVEIAGVRVLYTGDYSREEDRHLKGAEVPTFSPDLCIIESTFGIQIHEPREVRERRFVDLVTRTVLDGGRVLIPAFVFGRAQELLLILDEHWQMHPELQSIPVQYASPMARKAMVLYSTYTGSMNERMREECEDHNPFDFKFIKPLRSIAEFEDKGPSVVLASPGGLQSGLSRQLFDMWCQDARNMCLIPGFVVEGTLAKVLLSEPKEVPLINGTMVPLNMQVQYISFAAHADFNDTSTFLESLEPPNIVLVHGEATEMGRLRSKLQEQFKDRGGKVLMPKNCQTVDFHFKGDKTARAIGRLAHTGQTLEELIEVKEKLKGESKQKEVFAEDSIRSEATLGGILVEKDFSYQMVAPEDLSSFTQLTTGAVIQRQAVPYQGPFRAVKCRLQRMFDDIEDITAAPVATISVGGRISIAQEQQDRLVLQWVSDPVADMLADAMVAVLLQLDGAGQPTLPDMNGAAEGEIKEAADGHVKQTEGKEHEFNLLCRLLTQMFGDIEKKDDQTILVKMDQAEAIVSLPNGSVVCKDINMKILVQDAVTRLLETIRPVDLAA